MADVQVSSLEETGVLTNKDVVVQDRDGSLPERFPAADLLAELAGPGELTDIEVSTDDTITGVGTDADPLGVATPLTAEEKVKIAASLETVATDATITGDGTSGNPLSAVGGGGGGGSSSLVFGPSFGGQGTRDNPIVLGGSGLVTHVTGVSRGNPVSRVSRTLLDGGYIRGQPSTTPTVIQHLVGATRHDDQAPDTIPTADYLEGVVSIGFSSTGRTSDYEDAVYRVTINGQNIDFHHQSLGLDNQTLWAGKNVIIPLDRNNGTRSIGVTSSVEFVGEAPNIPHEIFINVDLVGYLFESPNPNARLPSTGTITYRASQPQSSGSLLTFNNGPGAAFLHYWGLIDERLESVAVGSGLRGEGTTGEPLRLDLRLNTANLQGAGTAASPIDINQTLLDTINSNERGSTADQTGAEIVEAIDTELGSEDWKGGGSGVDYTQAEKDKLAGIENRATADQSGVEIVSAINTRLGQTDWQSGGGTASGTEIINAINTVLGQSSWQTGEADQTGPEIVAAINAQLGQSTWQTGGSGSISVVINDDAIDYETPANERDDAAASRRAIAQMGRDIEDAIDTAITDAQGVGEGLATVGTVDNIVFTSSTEQVWTATDLVLSNAPMHLLTFGPTVSGDSGPRNPVWIDTSAFLALPEVAAAGAVTDANSLSYNSEVADQHVDIGKGPGDTIYISVENTDYTITPLTLFGLGIGAGGSGGGDGGIARVATDDTIDGDGTAEMPLGVDGTEMDKVLFGDYDTEVADPPRARGRLVDENSGFEFTPVTGISDVAIASFAGLGATDRVQGSLHAELASFGGALPQKWRVQFSLNGGRPFQTVHLVNPAGDANQATADFVLDSWPVNNILGELAGGALTYTLEILGAGNYFSVTCDVSNVTVHTGDGTASHSVRAEISKDTASLREEVDTLRATEATVSTSNFITGTGSTADPVSLDDTGLLARWAGQDPFSLDDSGQASLLFQRDTGNTDWRAARSPPAFVFDSFLTGFTTGVGAMITGTVGFQQATAAGTDALAYRAVFSTSAGDLGIVSFASLDADPQPFSFNLPTGTESIFCELQVQGEGFYSASLSITGASLTYPAGVLVSRTDFDALVARVEALEA